MSKKLLCICVLLGCSVSVFASRFALDVSSEMRLYNGWYDYVSPSVYFETNHLTEEHPYSLYSPGLSLNIGYSYANIKNYNLPNMGIHYSLIRYHSLYCGISFLNKFMIDRRNSLILSAFADVRLGGKYAITDGGNTGCGIRLDYKYFFTDHIAFGCGIIGTYSFAGDYKGFDGGVGVSFLWLI